MAIVVDTSALVVASDKRDARRATVARFFEHGSEAFFLSPFILAEADYLIGERLGRNVALSLLDDVARGSFILEPFDSRDVERCARVCVQYRDLSLSLADASIMILADRVGTRRLLTFDERDFRAVQSVSGEPFVLLPADQPA